MRMLWIIAALTFQAQLFGQANSRASDLGKYASPTRNWCLDAGPRKNLFISQPVRVDGTVSDEIEKPITNSDTWVTVKDLKTNQSITSDRVGAKGHFDLGRLDAGEYYLRVRDGHGVVYRLVELGKERNLSCSNEGTCHLGVFIWLKGRDFPHQ